MSGPPVLLIPGWGGSAYLFSRNIPDLAAAGLHVLALDLLGHGGSDKPGDRVRYSIAAHATSIVELMDSLAIRACALVGQSFGGRVAAEVAFGRPERVSRLALIGSVGFGRVSLDVSLRAFSAMMPPRLAPWLTRRSLFRATLRATDSRWRPPDDDAMSEFFAPAAEPAFARALLFTLRQMDRRPLDATRLRALPMPVLLIVGERDRIVRPPAISSPLGAWVREHVVVIPDAGHLTNFETPAPVNAALIE
ncbi:MAG: alpha/beta fold hydrolase, partial [Gemmatimonadaceae bacterium]